jgi:glycosyltransferase involved in cell wall biosynthesis
MNISTVAFMISSSWLGTKLLSTITEIFGKTWYDFRQIREQKRLYMNTSRKALRKRPLISVVIYAHNAQDTIERCLESIVKSRYRNLEIIVINNGSTDKTRSVVHNFMKTHPKKRIRLVTKRAHLPNSEIVLQRSMIKGELIMRLNDRHRVGQSAFKNIVKYFALNDIHKLIPATRIKPHRSLLGLLQQYDTLRAESPHALGIHTGQDFYSVARARKKSLRNEQQTHYADDVLLLTEPLPSYSELFRHNMRNQSKAFKHYGNQVRSGKSRNSLEFIAGTVLLLEPLVVAYFLYLALQFQRPEPLVLTWTVSVFILMFYAWSDRHTTFRQKIRLIILAPSIYAPIYVLSLTRLIVFSRVLFKNLRADWQSWQYVGVKV